MNGRNNEDTQTRDCTLSGALVDENGEERPITEDMIQQACDALEDTGLGNASNDEQR